MMIFLDVIYAFKKWIRRGSLNTQENDEDDDKEEEVSAIVSVRCE